MCGNEAVISDEHDIDKNEKKHQKELETSKIIIEQIDGTPYTFDPCVLCIDVQKVECCIWKQLCR